jgi:hypothetical protein
MSIIEDYIFAHTTIPHMHPYYYAPENTEEPEKGENPRQYPDCED